jgi:hypothetical protein
VESSECAPFPNLLGSLSSLVPMVFAFSHRAAPLNVQRFFACRLPVLSRCGSVIGISLPAGSVVAVKFSPVCGSWVSAAFAASPTGGSTGRPVSKQFVPEWPAVRAAR